MTLHDSVGILVWTNKSLYEYLSLMPISAEFEPELPVYPEEQDTDLIEKMGGYIIHFEFQQSKDR